MHSPESKCLFKSEVPRVYNLKRFMFTKVRFFIISIRDEEIDTQSFNLK